MGQAPDGEYSHLIFSRKSGSKLKNWDTHVEREKFQVLSLTKGGKHDTISSVDFIDQF